MAFAFNPLDREIETTLVLPLYYTGLTTAADVRCEDGSPVRYPLNGKFQITVPLKVRPRSWTWLAID